jgi:hypothetical protein
VDLRSLPLAFLVLDKRAASPLPAGAVRIIGRPRIQKAYALLFGCDGSGVGERRLAKRRFADEFRRIKRGDFEPLQVWECRGDEIAGVRPVPPAVTDVSARTFVPKSG